MSVQSVYGFAGATPYESENCKPSSRTLSGRDAEEIHERKDHPDEHSVCLVLAANRSPFALPLDTPTTSPVEVVVVGGGLLGAASCYWLARAGVRVVLLEREALAFGATGRNGGFVRIGPAGSYLDAKERLGAETARHVMTITTESRALLRHVLDEEVISCDYREPGSLRLAISEAQAQRYQREIAELKSDGFEATWLDRNQTQELIRTPLGEEVVGALFRPEQGLVHSARLVYGLMEASIRHGARA